jgi:hypothetical protein
VETRRRGEENPKFEARNPKQIRMIKIRRLEAKTENGREKGLAMGRGGEGGKKCERFEGWERCEKGRGKGRKKCESEKV